METNALRIAITTQLTYEREAVAVKPRRISNIETRKERQMLTVNLQALEAVKGLLVELERIYVLFCVCKSPSIRRATL